MVPRWGRRMVSGLLCLTLGALIQLVACSKVPETGTDPAQAVAEPDSLPLPVAVDLDAVPDTLPDWPEAPAGASSPSDWEAIYQEALQAAADGRIGRAHDLLFTLQEMTTGPVAADADSLYLQHRRSLARRITLLAGLIAEQRAYAGPPASADSVLTAEYLALRGFDFPDSLVPATGTQLPSLQADLLKVQHSKVDRWIDYFTGRGRKHFQVWLDRKAEVDSLVGAILVDEGLPADLVYLAMIESGLSTRARSNVGAVGPWQFMAGTARDYGLGITWWVDERRDLVKSTRAAAAYMRDLYDQFGDWALVLAAYNSGEGRIRRQLRLHGHDNFWDFRLPRQTMEYVPKFIAAARIGRDPELFGFAVGDAAPLRWDEVPVDDATDLGLVAQCAGADEAAVVRLNPALLRRATPPGVRQYPVRVPVGTGGRRQQGSAPGPGRQAPDLAQARGAARRDAQPHRRALRHLGRWPCRRPTPWAAAPSSIRVTSCSSPCRANWRRGSQTGRARRALRAARRLRAGHLQGAQGRHPGRHRPEARRVHRPSQAGQRHQGSPPAADRPDHRRLPAARVIDPRPARNEAAVLPDGRFVISSPRGTVR